MKLYIYAILLYTSLVAAAECKALPRLIKGSLVCTQTTANKNTKSADCGGKGTVNVAVGVGGQHGKLQIKNADTIQRAFSVGFRDGQNNYNNQKYFLGSSTTPVQHPGSLTENTDICSTAVKLVQPLSVRNGGVLKMCARKVINRLGSAQSDSGQGDMNLERRKQHNAYRGT